MHHWKQVSQLLSFLSLLYKMNNVSKDSVCKLSEQEVYNTASTSDYSPNRFIGSIF